MENLERIVQTIQSQGMRLLGGLLVLAIGLFLAHWILKFIDRGEHLSKIDPTLRGFLKNLLKMILYIVVALTAAGAMGIPLTSFVTLLASVGVAISLALQGALGNFVGGMMILMLKHFRVGDYLKIGETEGTVQNIGVFYTELTTPDNRHISLPNGNLTNTAIVNYTREGTRRIDVSFSVSYLSDMDMVYATLSDVAANAEKLLSEPAPIVRLTECADSSLTFMIRAWCNAVDYWDATWELLDSGKRALDAAGIEIPYPQLDVHMR